MKAKLNDVVCIITDKKSSSPMDVNNYVSTENILPNREGIKFPAKSLPRISKILSYQKNDVLVSNIRPYFKKIWFSDRDGVRSNDVLAFLELKIAKFCCKSIYIYYFKVINFLIMLI